VDKFFNGVRSSTLLLTLMIRVSRIDDQRFMKNIRTYIFFLEHFM